jgi:hypothetical protein
VSAKRGLMDAQKERASADLAVGLDLVAGFTTH